MEDYKEKYEMALERAKIELSADTTQGTKNVLMTVFPELKESEDERFRKYILKCCEETIQADDRGLELSMDTTKKLKSWLEKQKPTNDTDEEIVNTVKDTSILDLIDNNDERIRKGLIKGLSAMRDIHHHQTFSDDAININEALAWLEMQGANVDINPSEFEMRLNRLLKQFESLPKEDIVSSLSFYLNVIQNDGTYKAEEKQDEQKSADNKEKLDILNFIRKETCCGLAEANNALLKLIKVLKERPLPIMDKPRKLKIEWEE